ARAEADLGEALGVEEVWRLEVAVQLLVLGVHAGDLGRGGADAVLQAGRIVVEAAAERVRARVGDLERDVRVHRIGAPVAGRRSLGGGDGGHWQSPSPILEFARIIARKDCLVKY